MMMLTEQERKILRILQDKRDEQERNESSATRVLYLVKQLQTELATVRSGKAVSNSFFHAIAQTEEGLAKLRPYF